MGTSAWLASALARVAEVWNPPPSYDDLRRGLLRSVRDRLDPATGGHVTEGALAPPPADWVVRLSPYDHGRRRPRLPEWTRALATEVLAEDRRHGSPMGGAASVRVERDPALRPGSFVVARDRGPAAAGPGGAPAPVAPGRPRLVLPYGGTALPGDDAREVALIPGRTVLGRGPEAGVRLGDTSVSLVHATVDLDDDGTVRLRDAGSANGVRVDGVRVQEAELVDGNRVELGEAAVVFRRDPVADDGGRQGGELGEQAD